MNRLANGSSLRGLLQFTFSSWLFIASLLSAHAVAGDCTSSVGRGPR